MPRLLGRLRGLIVAIAVLALTAGVALAARPAALPQAAGGGLERAAAASGQTVPVAGQGEENTPDADEENTDADDAEPLDTPSAPEAAEHPDNHGATVSAAARGATPTTFDNHGQYVKSIATVNHGQEHAAAATAAHPKPAKPSH
jgi:hypothetical protein